MPNQYETYLPTSSNSSSNSSSSSSHMMGVCCQCWQFLHSTFTLLLTVLVVLMFIQTQRLSHRLNEDELEMKEMRDNVISDQQGQIQALSVQVQQGQSLGMIYLAGTFTVLTCLLSMFHMSNHLRFFHEPAIQRKILAILWMSPIYAITSFLSLLFPVLEGLLAIIKDFYEAYVIYMFLSFLISVLGRGDRNAAVDVLSRYSGHLKEPSIWFSKWYHPPPAQSNWAKANAVLLECQILAMQFVFCRPLTSVASFVLNTVTDEDQQPSAFGSDNTTASMTSTLLEMMTNTTSAPIPDTSAEFVANESLGEQFAFFASPTFLIAVIQSVSVGLAFSGLLKFYHAVREELTWCQPFSKFLCIKGVVFMTFWQGLVISIVVNVHKSRYWDGQELTPLEKSRRMQNTLICLEMLFFAVAHWCTFPVEEWEANYRPRQYARPGIGLGDFVSDVGVIMQHRRAALRKNSSSDQGEEPEGTKPPPMDEQENEQSISSNTTTATTTQDLDDSLHIQQVEIC